MTVDKTKSSNAEDALLYYFEGNLTAGDNKLRIYYDGDVNDNAEFSFWRMSDALLREKRDIIFQTNEGGRFKPEQWAHKHAQVIRTVEDIVYMKSESNVGKADWKRIVANYEKNVVNDKISKANNFYDADSIIIGNSGLKYEEKVAQFTLWCMMNTPLMLSFDLTKMSHEVLEIITNREVIAINQDDNVVAGTRVQASNNKDVIAKPLADGSVAITFFNKDNSNTFDVQIDMMLVSSYIDVINEEAWDAASSYKCVDLWTKKESTQGKTLQASRLDPHAVVVYRCWPNK